MTKSVAILGCGPAGLMVAHAAALSGWDFRIYSRKQRSPLHGAQYLHQPLPGVNCGSPKLVRYTLKGTPESYRRKVYGETWDGTVSPEDFEETHYAWDIRAAYGWLWVEYQNEISHFELPPSLKDSLAKDMYKWHGRDLVISTVPRTLWDNDPNNFESQKIWALGDGDYPRVHMHRPEENTVILNGHNDTPWYRVSNIFGYCTMEWPYLLEPQEWHELRPPARGAAIVDKPLRHTSTAASDFLHMGRFGAWRKGYLSHEAFYEAMKAFASDSVKGEL